MNSCIKWNLLTRVSLHSARSFGSMIRSSSAD